MEEMNFKDLIDIFLTKKIQIILIIAIFLVIGFMYSYIFLTPEYQSKTSILLAKSNTTEGVGATITSTDITLNQKLVSTYSELLKTESLLTQVISNLGIQKTPEELKENITVSAKADTEIIEIKVVDKKSEMAAKIANEVANVFIEKVAKEYYNMDNVYIVDQAKKAEIPYNISHAKDFIKFGIIGIIVAIIYALVTSMLDTTIKSKEEVEKKLGLTVLTTIPLYNFDNMKKGGRK